jgi:hypothetical protein
VGLAEDPRDSRPRLEARKAICIRQPARVSWSRHATIMRDSGAPASMLSPAARAALRTLSPFFSPTHFHEEPFYHLPNSAPPDSESAIAPTAGGEIVQASYRGVIMAKHLEARARQLADPPLWCWELINPATGLLVTSSWTDFWVAYPSSDAALGAADEYWRRKSARTTTRPNATRLGIGSRHPGSFVVS